MSWILPPDQTLQSPVRGRPQPVGVKPRTPQQIEHCPWHRLCHCWNDHILINTMTAHVDYVHITHCTNISHRCCCWAI